VLVVFCDINVMLCDVVGRVESALDVGRAEDDDKVGKTRNRLGRARIVREKKGELAIWRRCEPECPCFFT